MVELEVAPSLHKSLGAVFGGWGEEASSRLKDLVQRLRPAFDAQVKVAGRLPPEASSAIAYNFFAQEHGWLIKGLEPPFAHHGSHELHEISVLRKAPVLAEAMEEVQRHGFSLGDLAAVLTAIERLMLDESISLLEAAYELNGQDEMDWISGETLHDILRSYLLVFRQGSRANLVDMKKHQELKARARKSAHGWQQLTSFESESVSRFSTSAGFSAEQAAETTRQYSFEDAAQIARDVALRYGQWQDAECKSMSADLLALDDSGTGRVPLSIFHKQPRNAMYGYQFTESAEYLRSTGALEETVDQGPKVLMANYVIGPSNCIATSQFLSVCCLNTCEGLQDQLWKSVRAPNVEAGLLARHIGNLSTPIAGSREMAAKRVQELHEIAASQSGKVDLTKPDFRQWLHRAFPRTCPSLYPSSFASPFPGGQPKPVPPSQPTVPPSHRPNAEECTRTPEYFL